MKTYVALLRGINVGKAKRIRMADLREAFTDLGYADVKTLLNSGNVIFRSPRAVGATTVRSIEASVSAATGVSAAVTLLGETELLQAVDECPLLGRATDPSRLMVAVPASAKEMDGLRPLEQEDWAPEAFAAGTRVAYLWCPNGVAESALNGAVKRALAGAVTARNWNTVTKLAEILGELGRR